MPIVSIDVRDGDPTIQASGEYRGQVTATFASGRLVTKNVRAPNADAWADLLANLTAKIETEVSTEDAVSDIVDADIEANGEATIAQRAVAYLREAMQQELASDAYALMARFDTYRQNQGWNWNQVVANLMAAGLGQDEFDEMRTAYQYLSGGGRPAIMAQAKTVQENWENR